ncbi:signal peptidase I [Candidatus Saccharibacteria bacterium]|nr:signal peptidase I [Candidatus Saccharibacteria bacterium]
MKRNEKSIVIISVALLVLAIVILFTPISSTLKTILQIGLVVLFAVIANIALKPQKTNHANAKIALKSVVAVLVAVLILGFTLGLVIGFTRTFVPLSIEVFLNKFLPIVALIVAQEFLRRIIVGSAYESKLMLVLVTITLAAIAIFAEIGTTEINSIETAFIVTSTIIMPTVAEGMLSTFLMKRAGMAPTFVYRFAKNLYLYILPIAPAFSQYLYSVMWVLVPYLIYRLARKNLPKEVVKHGGEIDKAKSIRRRNISIVTVPAVVFLLTLVVLISGILRYKMIAIASGSMSPAFDRGDAIIYDKESELKVGDVMAYSMGGNIITHRIVKIEESDKKKLYYTKGDANNTEDNYAIMEDLVLGKVSYVVKYIGIPTVWFNEKIGNL